MRFQKTSILIGALASLVCGCDQISRLNSQERVCGSWLTPEPEAPVEADQYEQSARACVERSAARLARGRDALDIIADTVIAICHQEIERLEDGEIVSFGRMKPLDQQVRDYWHGRAMYIGAQVRAADCYPDA